jgi:hypothetical protein
VVVVWVGVGGVVGVVVVGVVVVVLFLSLVTIFLILGDGQNLLTHFAVPQVRSTYRTVWFQVSQGISRKGAA